MLKIVAFCIIRQNNKVRISLGVRACKWFYYFRSVTALFYNSLPSVQNLTLLK